MNIKKAKDICLISRQIDCGDNFKENSELYKLCLNDSKRVCQEPYHCSSLKSSMPNIVEPKRNTGSNVIEGFGSYLASNADKTRNDYQQFLMRLFMVLIVVWTIKTIIDGW